MARRKYRVEFKPAAVRDLKALPPEVQKRIKPKIDALADDPRPPGVKRLQGEKDLYRMRVGDYRIVYAVKDKVLLVLVVRIRHRRDAYRGL